MKWIARVFVFAAGLVLGTFADSLFSTNTVQPYPQIQVIDEHNPKTSLSMRGVKVMYAGLESNRGENPYLKFVIYNGLGHLILYSGVGPYISHDINIIGRPMDRIWECEIGNEVISIAPGDFAEVHVGSSKFPVRPRQTDPITVEFDLRDGSAEDPVTHTSEPFLLPEPFRQSIDARRFDP